MSTILERLDDEIVARLCAAFRTPVRLAAEPADVTFMSLPAVEIAHVGMDWPAASGPVTLTLQHLADAVTAANDDPHILPPRLKLGHDDPRFNESPMECDPFAYHGPLRDDGSPVYGKVTNLRLSEDGMVLLGDYAEVPSWLGNALPSAYPSRSLEGDFDVQTEGGKHYSFVITAVALLGEPLPAITCLDDLVRELTGGPEAVLQQAPVTLRRDAMPVTAEASSDAVRSQFFDEFAQGDRYWWWPVELRLDGGWVLADDDEGHLYRVPFTVDGDGNCTFADPTRGVLDFRPVPDTEAGEAEPVTATRVVRFATAAAAGRPKDRVRAANQPKGDTMTDEQRTALAVKHGLPEDATQEQIDEKLRADALAGISETEPEPEPAPEPEPKPTEPQAVAASVDPDALKQLQEDARLGREARMKQIQADRETLVDGRIKAGAITPASRTAHLAELSKGGEIEKAHLAYLEGLTAGVIPVTEQAVQAAPGAQAQLDAVMASFNVKPRDRKES